MSVWESVVAHLRSNTTTDWTGSQGHVWTPPPASIDKLQILANPQTQRAEDATNMHERCPGVTNASRTNWSRTPKSQRERRLDPEAPNRNEDCGDNGKGPHGCARRRDNARLDWMTSTKCGPVGVVKPSPLTTPHFRQSTNASRGRCPRYPRTSSRSLPPPSSFVENEACEKMRHRHQNPTLAGLDLQLPTRNKKAVPGGITPRWMGSRNDLVRRADVGDQMKNEDESRARPGSKWARVGDVQGRREGRPTWTGPPKSEGKKRKAPDLRRGRRGGWTGRDEGRPWRGKNKKAYEKGWEEKSRLLFGNFSSSAPAVDAAQRYSPRSTHIASQIHEIAPTKRTHSALNSWRQNCLVPKKTPPKKGIGEKFPARKNRWSTNKNMKTHPNPPQSSRLRRAGRTAAEGMTPATEVAERLVQHLCVGGKEEGQGRPPIRRSSFGAVELGGVLG
ncbi:hypothetical protein B0H16DRAFT_1481609 [Mycena metata]|uniref:Uncharacterized protein n=1 Tax=Mycena metata TaxID=1033252 RepID=A0AAD7GXH8_9AGAR|nr:hypothetical protein B0H16DRAFT_1481609 [Mycena metata]